MNTDNSNTDTLSTDQLPRSMTANAGVKAQAAETDIGMTTTEALALAQNFYKSVDALAALLPNMEAPHSRTVDFVRGHNTIPLEFLYTALAAVERTPVLQQVGKFDITEARATLQLLEAFRPVLDTMIAFASKLKYTLDSRRASLAAGSLQVYTILKGLARDTGGADEAVHVANMKRDLNRKPSKEVRQKKASEKVAKKVEAAKAYVAAHAHEVLS